jgi:hypothetical protein
VLLFTAGISAVTPLSAPAAERTVVFNRDVRPILSDNCRACHGPDTNVRKADLRLDQRATATKEVILPGRAQESPLIQRIFSNDPDDIMPPAKHRKKLTDAQKNILRDWINHEKFTCRYQGRDFRLTDVHGRVIKQILA